MELNSLLGWFFELETSRKIAIIAAIVSAISATIAIAIAILAWRSPKKSQELTFSSDNIVMNYAGIDPEKYDETLFENAQLKEALAKA